MIINTVCADGGYDQGLPSIAQHNNKSDKNGHSDDANTITNMIMIVMRTMAINTIMIIMKQC